MVQGYFTLQEAAQHLGMGVDALKQLAQRGQIRSFQDRGTLRFRIQDVQELARQRGVSSDPDLILGDASLPKSGPKSPAKSGPRSPKTPAKQESAPEVFDFEFDTEGLNLGSEVFEAQKSASKPKSGAAPRSGAKPRSGASPRPKSGAPSPQPATGSDSDVKLMPDDSVTGSGPRAKEPDSDVRLPDSGTTKPKTGLGSGARSPKPASSAAQPIDSGVRLVPMDSDSDVKIVGASHDELPLGESPNASAGDSNVRLESVAIPPEPEEDHSMLTEEINLDEEIRREEERLKEQSKKSTRVKPKSELKMDGTSPFELSESDVGSSADSSAGRRKPDDSSDFELAAAKEGSSDFDLSVSDDSTAVVQPDDSDDFSLELADDAAVTDDASGRGLTGPTSGISLSNPVDAGISLEDSSDSVDFDLSLEAEEATPKPAQMKAADDEGSSEFELSLELDDAGASAGGDSSEFELTLDDSSGEMAPLQDEAQAKVSGEADIFESDFEIPAASDDGEAATVDTELESSDFDIALDDSELAAEEESGSQVVALDEEEVEPLASGEVATVDEEDVAEIDEEAVAAAEDDEDDETDVREVVKVIRPAPWGVMPTIVMFPAVIVMLLVGFMGFELVQSSAGFRPPGFMSKTLGEMIGMEFPKR